MSVAGKRLYRWQRPQAATGGETARRGAACPGGGEGRTTSPGRGHGSVAGGERRSSLAKRTNRSHGAGFGEKTQIHIHRGRLEGDRSSEGGARTFQAPMKLAPAPARTRALPIVLASRGQPPRAVHGAAPPLAGGGTTSAGAVRDALPPSPSIVVDSGPQRGSPSCCQRRVDGGDEDGTARKNGDGQGYSRLGRPLAPCTQSPAMGGPHAVPGMRLHC